jgi:hypothetical protein
VQEPDLHPSLRGAVWRQSKLLVDQVTLGFRELQPMQVRRLLRPFRARNDSGGGGDCFAPEPDPHPSLRGAVWRQSKLLVDQVTLGFRELQPMQVRRLLRPFRARNDINWLRGWLRPGACPEPCPACPEPAEGSVS